MTAVLFDWRVTLFHDESDEDWLRASAASIGRILSDEQTRDLTHRLGQSARHPEVVKGRLQADCSRELHEATALLELRLAGFDDELALAVYKRDGDLTATMPYPDAADVLRTLRAHDVRVGVVSDIHYDLRPHFAAHDLADCVDTFTLSFQLGCQKPDPRLFEIAVKALDVSADATLMVGDGSSRDGGAVAVRITTLLLPPVPEFTPRGLDKVLRLACA